MGHLYPGILDAATDLTLVSANFGGHVEVLEVDDLRVRVADVSDADVDAKLHQARETFELTDSVNDEDLVEVRPDGGA
ncbi:hypothetical protein [Virgisporangium aurantiacum]|uniref:Uncharacterized protein n=1 Tax=Virgisporangium aurantiacum TaxID=175570 RepID=A0A8J3ZME1_9ACTN|nr:hypothetical protein [Virgisporangium aurantiacum]GIJ64070.1 hypothetical protein Vau01_115860 [Virgisporangium aurantiacum]